MKGFLLALGMNFIAELGDKTQLVTLTFATRYKPLVVLAAVSAGTAASQGVASLLGGFAGSLLPDEVVKIVAGLAFLCFGLWTLKGEDEEDEGTSNGRHLSPFAMIASTFFLAEMGDKTMLGNMALSATNSPLFVFLGGTAGMILSNSLAILVGNRLGEKLPTRAIKCGAAVAFYAFGVFSLYQGTTFLHPLAWVGIIPVTGCFIYLAIRTKAWAEPQVEAIPIETRRDEPR